MKRRILAMLLALAMFAGIGSVSLAEETDEFAQYLTDMYDEVEIEYRPDVRWWLAEGLNTDATLEKNLQQIYDSGFGAAEFLAMPEPSAGSDIYGWGSEEWTADSRLIIAEAAELGLGFSLTSGTHWANANLPDTYTWDGEPYGPDNKAASKELDYATILLDGGEQFNGTLPYPKKPESSDGDTTGTTSSYTEHMFVGVVAAKVVEERPESGQDYEYAEGTEAGVLDLGSVVNLTDSVVEQDGVYTLDWTAPDDGEYAVFAYWMHGTCQTATPSVSTNYTINYMDSYGTEALIDYWEENILTEDLRETVENSGRGEIYMDSLEVNTYGAGGLFWGYNFLDEFISRMGYDITPYLPFITADDGRSTGRQAKPYDYSASTDEDNETIEKARKDYYHVMTDMYVENVLEPLQTWLHGYNMKLRAEPSYGFNFEISTPAKYIDGIETESFAQNADVDLYRGMLGSANMYGRPFSSETGAVSGHNYYFNMDEWTQLCYLQFVNGINRTVFHGYSGIEGSEGDTYWPGHEGMYARFSERFNERQPASEFYPEWTQMLGRNQKALRQGNPSRDIAILRTDYNFINYGFAGDMTNFTNNYQMNDIPYYWSDYELQHNGYTYEYFSPQLLLDEENVSWTADALQPDGPNYQAIILYQEALELDAAQKLLEIAKDGLPIIFANNNPEMLAHDGTYYEHGEAASKSPSLAYSDEDVQAVVAEIKALPNVKTVDSPADAMEALQELDVYPRVQFTEPTDTILTISRDDAENGIYYTFAYNFKFQINEGDPATTEVLSIEGEGQPYFIDDWTGEVTKAGAYEIRDGRTYVEVSLLPGEAVLMAIDMEETPAAHAISTTADEAYIEDGVGMIRATASGEYETVLDNGETVTTTIEVPEAISLPTWDITIEDWNEGDKVVNTEEKFGHTTTEVYYTTKKTELSFPQSELVAWKDLPATEEQLATLTTASGDAPSMSQVSGIGTYTTTFTLPEGWTDANGAYLQIGSTNGSIVQVFVNGEKAPGVDTRTLRTDISDLLVEGENTIEVKLATTLTNRMIERDYQNNDSRWTEEFPTVQDYGMTGEVSIVPYTVAQVF